MYQYKKFPYFNCICCLHRHLRRFQSKSVKSKVLDFDSFVLMLFMLRNLFYRAGAMLVFMTLISNSGLVCYEGSWLQNVSVGNINGISTQLQEIGGCV